MKIILALSLLLSAGCSKAPAIRSNASGGASISGGGNGVRVGDRIILLDLFEHQLGESNLDIGSSFMSVKGIAITNTLPKGLSVDAVQQKIMDVAIREPVFAISLFKTIFALRWYLVNAPLVTIPVDTQVIAQQMQIASRNGSQVLINQTAWDLMDATNRLALITHEATAALADSALTSTPVIRAVNGALYDPNFFIESSAQAQNTFTFFPSVSKLSQLVGQSPTLMSYQDISTLPQANGTVIVDLPDLILAGDYSFDPQVRFYRPDGAVETIPLTDANIESLLKKIEQCHSGNQTAALVAVEIGAWHVDVKAENQLSNGAPAPRVEWTPTYQSRSRIACGAKASVASLNRVAMWLRLFTRYE